MKKLLKSLPFLVFILGLSACTETVDPDIDTKTFSAIYDSRNFDLDITPLDIKQTADGGYLILASLTVPDSQFPGAYLLKTDQFGKFQKELYVDATITNPTGPLTLKDGLYYFLGMDPSNQSAVLVETDPVLENLTSTAIAGLTYPMAYNFVDNLFLVLSYNNANKTSVISQVNSTGGILITKEYSIGAGDETEKPVIEHFFRTGKQYPFFVGKQSAGVYYFNGFYNYTFSLVFSDLVSDDPRGVVQGQQDDGGISDLQLVGSGFALSRFNFGVNYLVPKVSFQTNEILSASDLGGFIIPELISYSKVKIGRATIEGKSVLIYAADTQSRQIVLLYYDEASGSLIGSRYLGFSNPYSLGSFVQTSDGGLVVSGITYLAGRFPRLCLFKISADEIATDLN